LIPNRNRPAPGARRSGKGAPSPARAAREAQLIAGARGRLARLRRRPSVRALAAAVAARRGEAWLVGGAARDLLLGRPVTDVDFAVSGDPYLLARDLESAGAGTALPLSESAPRVARVAARHAIDLAAIEGGGIQRDLARRDFTANAIAVGLAGGDWIDPFGGISDLSRKRLRMLSEENLRDDPLRGLRAARFFATHGLTPDAETTAACERVAPHLSEAAPERIRVELEKLLAAPRAAPALDWAARTSLLGPTLGVALDRRSAAAIVRRLPWDAPSIVASGPATRLRLRLALLAAGLRLDPAAAAAWLASRRFAKRAAHEIRLLLDLARAAGDAGGADARWNWVRDAGPRADEALTLAALLDRRRARRSHARRASLARAARRACRPPRVSGGDLLAWLGLSPGPAVGVLLADLEVEALRGRVRSRREARRWLLDRIGKIASGPDRTPGRRLSRL
jgi:tRNA nucleotidyltransferase/poly(A) polymerase